MIPDSIIKTSYVHPVVVYDGICILCCRFISFLIQKDQKEVLRYTSLQNTIPDNKEMDSVFLVDKGIISSKSDVSVKLAEIIPLPWYFNVLAFIPKVIRNAGYDIIAKIRYRTFGKRDTCMNVMTDKAHLFINR